MVVAVDVLITRLNVTCEKPKQIGALSGRKIQVESSENNPIQFKKCPDIDEKIRFVKQNFTQIKNALKPKGQDHNAANTLTRELFEDVLRLTKKPITSYSQDDYDRVDEGLSLLSEIDTDFKGAYNDILLKYLNDRKDMKNLTKIYLTQIVKPEDHIQEGTKDFQIKLQSWIESIKTKNIEYEDRMIKELDTVLDQEKKITPSTEKRAEIEKFLLYAYANSDLNKRIREKKTSQTKAEKFLAEFTFITLGPKKIVKSGKVAGSDLRESIDEIRSSLKRPIGKSSLHEICKSLQGELNSKDVSIAEIERDLASCLEGYKTKDKTKNGYEAMEKEVSKFFALYSNGTSVWDTRRSKEILVQAHKILGAAKPHLLKGGQKHTPISQSATDTTNLVKKFIEKIEEANTTLDAFLADKNPKKLRYESLNTLSTFDSLKDLLDPIAESCSSFAGCHVLEDLINSCKEAEDLMHDIRFLSEVTDSYKPGDIILKDEVLYKNFTQSGSIALSQFSIFKNIANLKQFVTEMLGKKDIWSIQPYFTGDKTHARMIFPGTMVNSNTAKKIKVGRGGGKQRTKMTGKGQQYVISRVKKDVRDNPIKENKNPTATKLLNECASKLTTGAFQNIPKGFDEALKNVMENSSIRDIEALGVKDLLKQVAESYKDTSINESIEGLPNNKVEELSKILSEGMESIVDTTLEDILKKAIYTSTSPRTIDLTAFDGLNVDSLQSDKSMFEVMYRPQFDQLMTESIKGKISQEDVQKIFSKKLQGRVEGKSQWRALESIQIDQSRAARSFVIGLVPTYTFKEFIGKIWDYLFGPKGKLRYLIDSAVSKDSTPEEVEKIVGNAKQRFCSEIVVTLLKEALLDTEEQIQKDYFPNIKPPQTPPACLKKIFPDKFDDSWIHPNKLEDFLVASKCFEKVGTPKVMTQLFESVPHTSQL